MRPIEMSLKQLKLKGMQRSLQPLRKPKGFMNYPLSMGWNCYYSRSWRNGSRVVSNGLYARLGSDTKPAWQNWILTPLVA